LTFFQPEITGKRNISMKIYSFFIQLATLVFLSFYFMSLENILGELSTFGGHTFEDDGFYQVDVWVDPLFYGTAMLTLLFPRIMTEHFYQTDEQLEAFMNENPGGYYLIYDITASMFQYKSTESLCP
jgi:hypothetical protein